MRVLRVFHSATVSEWRGRERALRDRGVDVTVASAQRWHAGGVPVTLETAPDEQVLGVRTWGEHPALFLYDPRPLWRALGEKWDVIDIHEEPFALATAEVLLIRALRRNRAPYTLYTAQNLRKRYPFPFSWLERRALRGASGISACNSEAAEIAQDKGFPGRAQVIPLGVDLGRFATQENRDAEAGAPLPDAAVTVGLLGRLVAEKGVFVLLDALVAQPRLRARIAGTGPLEATLIDEAEKRGVADRVVFAGGISPDDIPRFYDEIDVLAVPSLPTSGWTEQFGRVAVEAMASGVPVVSSDAGALPDVVGGAGIVVAQNDPQALASALLDAAGERRESLRRAGFVRAEECSWPTVAEAYENLYSTALHVNKHPDFRTTLSAPAGPAEQWKISKSDSCVTEPEVIVVAYGTPDLLERALLPVAHLPVTVVDNSSLAAIADICERLGVRYLDPGTNLGFGAAVNRALADRLVPGADVLLLNPDAHIDASGVMQLHSALRADSSVASVGPQQVNESGSSARVTWVFPSPGRLWLEACGAAHLIRGPRFVIGSVLLLRAEALSQVGGFDERFFLYAEETDWAYRAHLLGWQHRAVDSVTAVHTGAATSSDPRRREAYFHASQERYYRKHFGRWGWVSARLAQLLGSTVRALILRGERGAEARRRAALYRLGPLRVERRFREVT